MISLYEAAYAKVNLTLDVLCKREDGYHDIKSVMQTLSLQDDIQLDLGTGGAWQLCSDQPGIPADSRNLAWKAAELFFREIGKDPDGLTIHITKRIPSQAGMGGGSADAAAVLRALNRHYGSPFSLDALADLSAQVGSDVPFCVMQGTAMAEGRGEKLRKLSDMPKCLFVVCKPEFSASTPELFRKLDENVITHHPNHDGMEAALEAGDLYSVAENVYNVFDPVVSREHPELEAIKKICGQMGALACQMTGSGSAVFAIMPSAEAAEAARNMLLKTYSNTWIAKPV